MQWKGECCIAKARLAQDRVRVERGGRGVQSARSCAIWQVRFISVGRLFWVSHEHVSTLAFNRHAIGVSPPRRGAAATGRALAVLASDRVRARRRRSDRRRGGEGGRGGDYGCRCTEMMAILASVRLIGSDRERRLGRFETAASPDRIPSVVLPLPAPTRRPLGHRDGSSTTLGVGRDDEKQRRLGARPSSSLHHQRGAHPTMMEFLRALSR